MKKNVFERIKSCRGYKYLLQTLVYEARKPDSDMPEWKKAKIRQSMREWEEVTHECADLGLDINKVIDF